MQFYCRGKLYNYREIRNPKMGLYEFTEGTITYAIPFEFISRLKHHFKLQDSPPSIRQWYNDLPGEDRRRVIVSGGKDADTGFRADQEPEE